MSDITRELRRIYETLLTVTPTGGQYQYFTDPSTGLKYRTGVRLGSYLIDRELTATGFNGTESIDGGVTGDWENIGGNGTA